MPIASETPPGSASPLPPSGGGSCVSCSPRTSPLPVDVPLPPPELLLPLPLPLLLLLPAPPLRLGSGTSPPPPSPPLDASALTPADPLPLAPLPALHAPARASERAVCSPRRSIRTTRRTRRSSSRATPRRE